MDEQTYARLVADITAQVLGKVSEMIAHQAPVALEGLIVGSTWDPADGTASVLQMNAAAADQSIGDQPIIHYRVPLHAPHTGDQYGPIGDERCTIHANGDGGVDATMKHRPGDSPGARAGQRVIQHRNPTTGAVDGVLTLDNDGPAAGDGLASFTWTGGALVRFATNGGHAVTMNDTTRTVTVTTTGGLSVTLDDAAGAVSIGGVGLDPAQDALMTARLEQASLTAFRAAMIAANVTNAARIVVPTVVGSTTVRARQ